MHVLKSYFDIIFFIIALILYSMQASFLPMLVLAFIFLWYRRELLWRLKCKKSGHPDSLFYMNGRPQFWVYLAFWFFGTFFYIGHGIVEYFIEWITSSNNILFFDMFGKFRLELFDTTLRYLYIGHTASEPEIGKALIQVLEKTERNIGLAGSLESLPASDRVRIRINGLRGILSSLFIYMVCFGRTFVIQPFYVYYLNKQNARFEWRNIRLYYIVLFLLLCWMFFYLPVHRSDCPIGRSGVLCSNLGTEGLKYIVFPARIMLYWSIILFFINNFLNDILNAKEASNVRNQSE